MDVTNRNEATLELYLLNWSLGDEAGITKLLAKNFTFTRLHRTDKEEILDKEGFKSFVAAFKAQAAENGGPLLGSHNIMSFKNIIQRLIGETTFETGQWIVPGFTEEFI